MRLDKGAVQVWQYRLGRADGLLARAHATLSAEERERAGRIRAGLPREEFMAARGLLRMLLGEAMGESPEELRFALGAQGKPGLKGGGIDFNVSHARGCVLLAISRAGAVGVDVEPVDRAVEAVELAEAHFHPEEIARIRAEADEARRLALFFRCWTRKEAVVKADGRGLQVPLAGFCVLPFAEPAGESSLVQVFVPGAGALWVRHVAVGNGFQAALAFPNRETRVDYCEYSSQAAAK